MEKVVIFMFLLLSTALAYSATPADSVRETTAPTFGETKISDIPYKPDDPGMASLIVRVIASLALVLALAAGVVYLLKRYLPGWRPAAMGGSSRISVLEIKRLTPKTLLFLIQVDDKRLLLAQSNDTLSLMPLAEITASPASPPSRTEP